MSPGHPRQGLGRLKPLAGRALEEALNRAVALDPDTLDELARLQGRRIEVVLGPELALAITVEGRRLRVGPAGSGAEPDLSIQGTLGSLLGQFAALRPREGRAGGGLRISGDAELARSVQHLAREFAPDWDKPFTDLFGEVMGGAVARAVREALAGARRLGAGLARDTAEYLSEERRDIASAVELETFHDQVDTLRDDVERIARRIARLGRPGAGQLQPDP